MNSPSIAGENIIKSVRIRNYRVFEDIEVTGLSRINLITGRNNSGKTSLLEALFLLSGAGNPELLLNQHIIRGTFSPAVGVVSPAANTIQEMLWKPMFPNLDTKRKIEIEAHQSIHGSLSLRLSLERSNVIELPFSESHKISAENSIDDSELVLSFKRGVETEAKGRIKILAGNIQIKQSKMPLPFPVTIVATGITNPQEDANRLGQLRKQKQGHLPLDALKVIERRLQGIEDNSSSGVPAIWGDIGLPELVPLAVMGEGMMRVARLVLSISAVPNGVVLVDEIETGLHHSVLTDVWKAVDAAARQFGTQVIATTHSIECMQAAGEALNGSGGLALHRLEATDSGNRCVTYDEESIAAAIRHDFEVR